MSDVHLKYRPEIDGLRAIAVLAVILFHAKIPGMAGGFVGVDIFFVISGFLITTIIARELDAGSFSFGSFYERRARRILPALLAVLIGTTIAASFLQGPYALVRLGQGLVAVTTFVSNIFFWNTTNYFTAGLDNPLLHTWSLSVEEQFYVLFPLLMIAIWRFARRSVVWVLLICALASLAVSEAAVQTGRSLAAFYWLPTRAYELLIGSLAALSPLGTFLATRPNIRGVVGWLGAAGVFGAILTFDSSVFFPGLSALIPAVGSAFVLLGATRTNSLGRILSVRPLVWVGLISYSAYLVHQPLFTFAHIIRPGFGIRGSLILTGLALVLGWISWRVVEMPFRDRAKFKTRPAMWTLGLGSLAVFGIGMALWVWQGAIVRHNEEQKRWQEYDNVQAQTPYVITRFNALEKDFDEVGKRRVLVIGDSQAQDFVNMAAEAGAWKSDEVRTIYVPAQCQIVWTDDDVSAHIPAAERHMCANARSLKKSTVQVAKADVIFLVANWHLWSASRLRETIQRMNLRSDQRLFVAGTKEFAPPDIRNMMRMTAKQRAEVRSFPNAGHLELGRTLQEGVAGLGTYVDFFNSVCADRGCPAVTPDDELISYDRIHLTEGGARYLGPILFRNNTLREFARAE
ncbi:hypothetical protein AXY46_04430 [Achromobacter xylosoxidans]|nr:hypothetical protein AXY46_04430 [Achromobacter xylosoxidans]